MHQSSLKEYEFAKAEIRDIKNCITRYFSFILGTNGVIIIMYKLLDNKIYTVDQSKPIGGFNLNNDLLINLPIIEIFIITSLYLVLSYKFGSHNRLIGFIQLLTQEIKFLKLDKNQKLAIEDTENLDKGYNSNELGSKKIKTIISWDYIMSRYYSRIKTKKYPRNHYNRLDFRFELNERQEYSQLNEYDDVSKKINIIEGFLQNIVWNYYRTSFASFKYYNKFNIKSWKYPTYIYFLTVLQIGLLLFFIYQKGGLTIPVLAISILVWVYLAFDLYQAQYGFKSINYYCWSFFTYRVQLLNSHGIRPVYFSTSFIRYFKSARIINALKNKEVATNLNRGEFTDEELKSIIEKLKEGKRINKKGRKLLKNCRHVIISNTKKKSVINTINQPFTTEIEK